MTKTTSVLGLIAIIAAIVLLGAYWYKTTDNLPKDHPKQQERWDDWELDEEFIVPPEEPEEEVPDIPKTYKEALEIGTKTGKPIFLIFGADWCTWCQEMRKTLADSEVQKALDGYIVYHADSDKEPDLVKQYGVGGIPAYFVVDSSEKIIKDGKGYKETKRFLAWLK